MQYKTLKEWSYEPIGKKPQTFKAGDLFIYPGAKFPTPIPIDWLLEQSVVEPS